jgi:hypothetical protein
MEPKQEVRRFETAIKKYTGYQPRYIYGKTENCGEKWGDNDRKYTVAYIIDTQRKAAIGTIASCNRLDVNDKNEGKKYALKRMTGVLRYIEGREAKDAKPIVSGTAPRFIYISDNLPIYPAQTPNMRVNGKELKEFDRFLTAAMEMMQNELSRVLEREEAE